MLPDTSVGAVAPLTDSTSRVLCHAMPSEGLRCVCRHDLRLEEWPKPASQQQQPTPPESRTFETLTSTPRPDCDSTLHTVSPTLPPSTARTGPFSKAPHALCQVPSIHVGSASVRGGPMHHAENSARGTESSAEAIMHAGPSTAPDGGFQRLLCDMHGVEGAGACLLYTSPSPRDRQKSRMPSSA